MDWMYFCVSECPFQVAQGESDEVDTHYVNKEMCGCSSSYHLFWLGCCLYCKQVSLLKRLSVMSWHIGCSLNNARPNLRLWYRVSSLIIHEIHFLLLYKKIANLTELSTVLHEKHTQKHYLLI